MAAVLSYSSYGLKSTGIPRASALGAILILASGCECINCGTPPYPTLVEEVELTGVTLGPDNVYVEKLASSYVERLDRNPDDPLNSYIRADLVFYFFPHADHRHIETDSNGEELSKLEYRSEPYEYRFSIEENGQYTPIQAVDYPGNHLLFEDPPKPIPDGFGYYSVVDFKRSSRFTRGSRVVLVGLDLSVPVTATHVELWFRETEGADKQLSNRVALGEFYVWRRYIAGLVDEALSGEGEENE